jgi:hypothetical protein
VKRLAFYRLWLLLALPRAPVHAAPETLQFQVTYADPPGQEDTVFLWTDYERLPTVPPPRGFDGWLPWEKDSAWTSDSVSHLRYSHGFYVTDGKRDGSGTDYIYFNSTPPGSVYPDDFQYEAGVGFSFGEPDGQTWDSGNRLHYRKEPRLGAVMGEPVDAGSRFTLTQSGKPWNAVTSVILLSRADGWTGPGAPLALSLRPPAGKREGLGRLGFTFRFQERGGRALILDARGRVLERSVVNLTGGSPSDLYSR